MVIIVLQQFCGLLRFDALQILTNCVASIFKCCEFKALPNDECKKSRTV